MSTPSRVTRSSSRQPERLHSTSSASSSSSKKSTGSSSKKKPTVVREESPAAPARRQSTTGSAKKKATASLNGATPQPAARQTQRRSSGSSAAGYQTSDQGASVADELMKRTNGSRRYQQAASESDEEDDAPTFVSKTTGSRRTSAAAAAPTSSTPVVTSSTRQPLVALLPHALTYVILVGVAHFLVAYDFASTATQQTIVRGLVSRGLTGDVDNPAQWLALADKVDLAFWVVVPLYLVAGFLLRWGTALVVGAGRGASRLATNLARVLSAGVFLLTLAAQCELGVDRAYESLNALFVLQFAFLLQEFLLSLRDLSSARRLFSLVALAVTGYLGFLAYALEKSVLPVDAQAIPSPALETGLAYAFQVVAVSSALGALSQVLLRFGFEFLATIAHALQRVVNYGATPILAVALYTRHPSLFAQTPAAAAPAAASCCNVEAAAPALLLVVLVWLLTLDTQAPKVQEDVVAGAATAKKSRRSA